MSEQNHVDISLKSVNRRYKVSSRGHLKVNRIHFQTTMYIISLVAQWDFLVWTIDV